MTDILILTYPLHHREPLGVSVMELEAMFDQDRDPGGLVMAHKEPDSPDPLLSPGGQGGLQPPVQEFRGTRLLI